MTSLAYLDSSAIVKLVLVEPGSLAMHRWYVEADRVITSRVGVIETHRTAMRRTYEGARLVDVLDLLEIFELDEDVAMRAVKVEPPALRTLNAIHIATALAIGPTLDAFVTYDDRQADAARAAGLPVVRPA
jgi:predicted nucleic acid-binding protein